jgi:hypothetical protein
VGQRTLDREQCHRHKHHFATGCTRYSFVVDRGNRLLGIASYLLLLPGDLQVTPNGNLTHSNTLDTAMSPNQLTVAKPLFITRVSTDTPRAVRAPRATHSYLCGSHSSQGSKRIYQPVIVLAFPLFMNSVTKPTIPVSIDSAREARTINQRNCPSLSKTAMLESNEAERRHRETRQVAKR